MKDVQAIAKDERNQQQKFNFRGIDAVMNAVGPSLRAHGVIVIPAAVDLRVEHYSTKTGTAMRNVTVHMQYTIHGPEGDTMIGSAWGEAADSGDKATSKAISVAYRTFLLQGLTIPTDEPDPDAESHQAGGPPLTEAELAKNRLRALMQSKEHGMQIVAWFAEQGYGELMKSDNVAHIEDAIRFFSQPVEEDPWADTSDEAQQ